MPTVPDFNALTQQVSAEFPRFKIINKADSWFMKLLGHVMVSSFMSSYVTTIWDTVYVPIGWDSYDDDLKCTLLRHERVHMRQARRLTFPLFAFLYLLAFFPVGLAYCRARFELEAYTESLAADKDFGDDYTSPEKRAWLASQFTGPAYAYMWPFSGVVNRWIDEAIANLDSTK